jgi:hypothetical protein
MARRRRRRRLKTTAALTLPWLLAETVWSSVQTIESRTRLITQGCCTAAEVTAHGVGVMRHFALARAARI